MFTKRVTKYGKTIKINEGVEYEANPKDWTKI